MTDAHRRARLIAATRFLGALAVLAVGVDHLVEYYVDYYRAVPTIGTLFVLDFAGSVVIASVLVAPLGRVAGRVADRLRTLAALAGIGLGAGTLGGLLVSETSGLFGFMETGYRGAIVLSIGFDVAAAGLLAAFLALRGSRGRATRPTPLVPIQKEISS